MRISKTVTLWYGRVSRSHMALNHQLAARNNDFLHTIKHFHL